LTILQKRTTPQALGPVLVLAATFIAYAAVSAFGFVYDDEAQVVHASFIRHWSFLPAYFTTHVWHWMYPHAQGVYYRPLFLSWLLVNFKLFALHAPAWHLALLAVHLLVTWQVYRLCLRLTGSNTAACVAALIFGLHPDHIEAVAWISGATDPLVAAFVLASLLAYIAFRNGESRRGLLLAHIWFALALLTKETGVLVPALLFCFDLIFPADEQAKPLDRAAASIRRLWPMAAIFGAYLIARYAALGGALAHRQSNLSAAEQLLTLPSLLVFYGRLLLYPVGLSAFYDMPYTTSVAKALAAAVAVSAVVATVIYLAWRSRSRAGAFGLVLLFVPLLPLLKLDVFAPKDFAHDRYLYLSSIGFALLLGLAFVYLTRGKWRAIAVASCALLAVAYAGATLMQSLNWASNITLYARGLAISPNAPVARVDFANEFLKLGDVKRAQQEYQTVLKADPNFWLARYGLGYSEYLAGDCESAARDLEIAARQNPTDADALFYLGQCRVLLGDRPNGIELMRRGIELDPQLPNLHAKLADVLQASNNPTDLRAALDLYRTEVSINPKHPYAARLVTEIESRLAR
jgi:tetratricopeptide (TPR) repeat protein